MAHDAERQVALGRMLVALSALAWSTAGIFAKGVEADVWTVLLWRGLLAGGVVSAWLLWRRGQAGLADCKHLGWAGWSTATVCSAATICFIAAFKNTAVANVAIIYATAPFAAAAVAWVWMRETPGLATVAAAGLCLTGVTAMVGGSAGRPDLIGDLLALGMTALMALMMVIMRPHPERPVILAVSLAALAFAFDLPATALELRVATWNLEHLDDMNGAGCVGRTDDDYAALAERIDALGADLIVFQEVGHAAATERVFNSERRDVEVSSRPSTRYGFACRGRSEGRLGHLATGISVREGLECTRSADFSALAGGNSLYSRTRWRRRETAARVGARPSRVSRKASTSWSAPRCATPSTTPTAGPSPCSASAPLPGSSPRATGSSNGRRNCVRRTCRWWSTTPGS